MIHNEYVYDYQNTYLSKILVKIWWNYWNIIS